MAKLKSSARTSGPGKSSKSGGAKFQARADQLSRSLVESAQQIWAAGMGAFGRAQEEGTRLFEALVDEGVQLEHSARRTAGGKVEAVRDVMEERVDQARERAADTWDRLEKVFEQRVQKALQRLGVPNRDELHDLTERVDQLNRELRALNRGTSAAGKQAPAKRASTKDAAAKSAAPAKKTAEKTAAPATRSKPSTSSGSATNKVTAPVGNAKPSPATKTPQPSKPAAKSATQAGTKSPAKTSAAEKAPASPAKRTAAKRASDTAATNEHAPASSTKPAADAVPTGPKPALTTSPVSTNTAAVPDQAPAAVVPADQTPE